MSPALQPEIDNLTTTMHQLEIMCVIVNIFIGILELKYTKIMIIACCEAQGKGRARDGRSLKGNL